jgi:hypothetical protein
MCKSFIRQGYLLKFIKQSFIFTLVLFLLLLNSNSSQAVEYGGVGGRPAFPRSENSRTESIFVHTTEVGKKINEGVKVINNASEKKTILVYAVDSEVSSGGAFACKQLTEEKKDAGSWISLEKTEITLDSLQSEVVPFTINIPQNASIGEHNGCIIIQEKKESSNEPGVNLTFRSGIRVALLIPGDITRKIEIEGFEVLQKDNGLRILRPKVKNLGNVSIDTNVQVKTDYFFGRNYFKAGGQYPVLRGETSDWNFELEKPYWGGFYKSYFTAEYDENKEAGVGTTSGKNLTKLQSPETWFFVFPTLPALIIELLVLLAFVTLIFFLLRALRKRMQVKRNWVDYTVSSGENVNSLAEKYGINWKTLAGANKLKPPYSLTQGQVIKVPPKK